MPAPLFDRIDTVILRVADYRTAAAWYQTHLALEIAFDDPEERLAVMGVGTGTSLTLWQWKPGENDRSADAASAFPIFAASDAAGRRERLAASGVRCSELIAGEGVRYFTFWDLDGNRLEACEVTEENGE